ncbi:MAG: exosome complex protein Rrp42 [Nanoarchaeota archaeon]|nr:exosome complex protein Rrp42 [Nanoarchaeota archaeon]
METSKITGDRIKKYLSEGKRFDGRKPEEFRNIEIEVGVSKNAEGSARVKIGNTEVIAGIKMNMGTPYPDSPDKGNMMVTAELLPLSSSRFESGPPRFPAIELARVVDRAIRESKVIQFEKLCIEKGEKVWTVFIDIYTINDDGNLLDAAGIAAIIALKNSKIPKYDAKEGKVLFGELTKDALPLEKEIPLSLTFHKIGDNFVVDPTREEEDVAETRVTIGSSNGIISSMQKGGCESLSVEEIGNALDMLEGVWKSVSEKIKKFI